MAALEAMVRGLFWLTPVAGRHFLRDRMPRSTVRRIRRMLSQKQVERFRTPRRAGLLEQKLWGGFSEQASRDLEDLKRHPATDGRNAAHAAWALARWAFARGDVERAYENVVVARLANRARRRDLGLVLLEVDCLLWRGESALAREILQASIERDPYNAHLILAMANTFADIAGGTQPGADDERLEWLNRLYARAGLVRVGRRDDARPLGMANLVAEVPPAAGEQPARVSVIVPTYAAQATLPLALESLLAQTWSNLEILVVDDCSPDGTVDVAREWAQRDPRVVVLRTPRNGGAYVARNFGLRQATGALVTTHDADDWSHPQKIEIQARALLAGGEAVANGTHWVRTFPNLFFRGTSRPSGQMVQWNHSSLMLHRERLLGLGGWDTVRVAADSELIRRLEHVAGAAAVARLLPGVPLSFALEDPASLTRQGVTHAFTLFHGVRREYHEASRYWMERVAASAVLSLDGERAFPVPGLIRPQRESQVELDLLVVMDFNLQGGAYVSTMNYLEAALALGLGVGVLQWRRYDLDVTLPLRPEVRALAQTGRVRVVTPGERVRVTSVLVGYPVVLQHAMDLAPELETSGFFVLVNQMAARLYSGGDEQYDPRQVAANVRRLFGLAPVWVPISGLVRDLMEQDGRYARVHAEDWTPLIDANVWCERTVHWRGNERREPVVGRHARDHYTKWPSHPAALRAAYCADRPCTVRLLGGADGAWARLGRWPRNWRVLEFGALEVRTFLEDLDFFVHYPHEDYIEEFGRSVLEAMAVGVPVILPPVFEKTFGPAALYAGPDEVWGVIERLWSSPEAYGARVEAGRARVRNGGDWGEFGPRLERLQVGGVAEPARWPGRIG